MKRNKVEVQIAEGAVAPKTDAAFVADARRDIGELWGLGRALTLAELSRALGLSEDHGGSHIGKLEKGKTRLSGPPRHLIEAFLDGYVPRHMADVVKPGYPRGRAS